jgi:hypothetical protein
VQRIPRGNLPIARAAQRPLAPPGRELGLSGGLVELARDDVLVHGWKYVVAEGLVLKRPEANFV